MRTLKQVQRNKGVPGVDGMTVDGLPAFLKRHWPMIRQQLIEGVYSPKPVLRVEIPKPDGRKRKLGIPTVLDRLIQQAIAQIMQEEWGSEFHNNSYGFRPYRNAHQAIGYAQTAVRQGYDWVIDCDLDWELEKRNLRFARYADDFVVFVGSKTAGERVMESLQRFIGESLRLTVNTQKSAVGRPWERSFLGFTFSRRGLKVKVSSKALSKLKATVKQLSRRTRGHSIIQIIAELRKSLLGWVDFCSCKIKLSIIHGGQSVFRYCRNTESSARSGQMGSTTIAVLYLEAMGKQRLSNAQKAGYRQISGVEYGEVCSWILAYKW